VRDVSAALALVLARCRVARYVLVGHSCGATLALQMLSDPELRPRTPPLAVAAVAGIFDLVAFARAGAAQRDIVAGAFGAPAAWASASPLASLASGVGAPGRLTLLLLAWSAEDELLDAAAQARAMAAAAQAAPDWTVRLEPGLEGAHDQAWSEGVGVAAVVRRVLDLSSRAAERLTEPDARP
jgi:kynurenine formamidase